MAVPPKYFDRMYAEAPDPWGFADRWYERRKCAPAGVLLACHSRHPVDGYPPGGDDGHERRPSILGVLAVLAEHREHPRRRCLPPVCPGYPNVTT